VGRDSFAVSPGWGIASGHTMVYWFAARDASGNQAVAPSPGGSWTVNVGRDWHLDFENGDVPGMFHGPVWYSYRDAWHPTQEASSPAGGTAWKCGADAPLPYPVHLDAALYLPLVAAVEPGTRLRFDHRYDLEEAFPGGAWDGGRVEIQVGSGPWVPLVPAGGYSHQFLYNSNPFQAGAPCWSGNSGGWRTEVADLTPYAPGPVRIRFRMLADDFTGYDGWLVDRIVLDVPDGITSVPLAGAPEFAPPWPNPARDEIRQSLTLASAAHAEWSLFDLSGRRVATLRQGWLPAGRSELDARFPAVLPDGVYFLRLAVEGQPPRVHRVARIR
jgi:hypothetical protein